MTKEEAIIVLKVDYLEQQCINCERQEQDDWCNTQCFAKIAVRMAIEALSERTGEWKCAELSGAGVLPKTFVECSNCGHLSKEGRTNFCCHCGADMRKTT